MARSRRTEMLHSLRQWQNEGGSLRGFAIDNGIPYSTLLYWRSQLEDELSDSVEQVELIEIRPQAHEPAPARFEVQLATGRVIRIPGAFDAGELQRLIQVLDRC